MLCSPFRFHAAVLALSSFSARAQFGPGQTLLTDDWPNEMQAIDVDADGDKDLVRYRDASGLVWMENADGLGNFAAEEIIIPEGLGFNFWFLEDMGVDGLRDLVRFDVNTQEITLASGLGDGLFDAPQFIISPVGNMAAMLAVDIDGNGVRDLLIAVLEPDEDPQLLWSRNNAGSFDPFVAIDIQIASSTVAIFHAANFDLGGGIDLLVYDADLNVMVFRNTLGDGTVWQVDTVHNASSAPWSDPQVLDVDGDGDLDLAEAGFPSVRWIENNLDEGGIMDPWTEHQLASWMTAGAGRFGQFGCGPGAGVVYQAANPDVGMQWTHWLPELQDFAYAESFPSFDAWSQPLLADLNGDGRDDLVLFSDGVRSFYPSTLNVPTTVLELPALPALCKFGDGFPLPDAIPDGGEWSGPNVDDNILYRGMLFGSGVFTLGHAYYEPGGCPVGAAAEVVVVEQPMVTPAVGPVICSGDGPIQFISVPPATAWINISPEGVLDPLTFSNGIVLAEFTDATGEVCAAEVGPLVVWTSLTAEIDEAGPFCINSGPQLITAEAPPFGAEWGGAISSWNSAGATFLPDQGAGTYPVILTVFEQQPGQCAGSDTLWVTVSDAFPQVEVSPVAIQCITSPPVDLMSLAAPPGGIWSGPGIVNDSVAPAALGAGSYNFTYSYFAPEGCATSAVLSFDVVAEVQVSAEGGDLLFCATDGPVQFTASPAGGIWAAPIDANGLLDPATISPGDYPVVYAWSNGEGCLLLNATSTFSVWATTTPVIEPVGVLCEDAPAILITGAPDGAWSGTVTGSGPGVWFDPSLFGAGTWPITLTAANPDKCPGSATVDVLVEVCTGVETGEYAGSRVFPNPFTDQVYLDLGAEAVLGLEVLDATGRSVRSIGPQPAGRRLTLDFSGEAPGAYQLRLFGADGGVRTHRAVKF
jgi:hypothetical protein